MAHDWHLSAPLPPDVRGFELDGNGIRAASVSERCPGERRLAIHGPLVGPDVCYRRGYAGKYCASGSVCAGSGCAFRPVSWPVDRAAICVEERPISWVAESSDPPGVLEALGRRGLVCAARRAAVVGCGGSGRARRSAAWSSSHDARNLVEVTHQLGFWSSGVTRCRTCSTRGRTR